ncbi:Predicted phosphodiesterase [Bryocella elongata]|uniref:Predicted phosphodiesterase n=1 Tax=Bryocella elongata TaxID=863522 RepID=A0A1H6BKU5_9BACT|nr:metallophosphoesterase family protein [Bryocella elongata]SEG61329.1 Predicted phosphodiesterase [Bryocella elongata]
MRSLILSDIHGNVHALEAVLAAATDVDQLWDLGDVVGYGATPNEVVALMRERAALNVRGNHDRVCCGLSSAAGFNPVAAEAAMWTHRTLTEENLAWLREMPQGPVRASETVLLAHGSPLHEDHYILSMRDAWAPLQRMESEITFFGHTHVQGGFSQRQEEWEESRPVFQQTGGMESFLLEVAAGARYLINPGSVGQPRDGDPRASFAIFDDAAATVTFYRVPYDIAAAQAAIREAGLPERLAARLSGGK